MKFEDLVKGDVVKVAYRDHPEALESVAIVITVEDGSVSFCDLVAFNYEMDLDWVANKSELESLEFLFHYAYSPEAELFKRFPEYQL